MRAHPSLLCGLLLLLGCHHRAGAVLGDEALIQRPADEAALVAQMAGMKAAADAVIVEVLAAPGPPAERYPWGADRIMSAMPAVYGPANAWLYGERAAKLSALCEGLGLDPDDCAAVDEGLRRD
jgi:hypothetical protein